MTIIMFAQPRRGVQFGSLGPIMLHGWIGGLRCDCCAPVGIMAECCGRVLQHQCTKALYSGA